MRLPQHKAGDTFVMICLLGAVYMAARITNTLLLISDPAEEITKLTVAITLCAIGLWRGRDFLQFTRTRPLFLTAALFVIAYHVIQVLKETPVYHGLPLLARKSAVAGVLGEVLLIATLCLFVLGILWSVSHINRARSQLEADIARRQRAEAILQESESRLQSVFRAAPVGIGLVSNRVLVEVNDRLCAMVGYPREELLGRSSRLLYPTQEDYDYVGREKYRQIREQGTGAVETHWQRKDGTRIDVWLSSTPRDPQDLAQGVIFTALDITERRRAKEEVRSIFDLSLDMVCIADIRTATFTRVNPAFERTLGYSEPELRSRSFLEFIHPDDVEATAAVVRDKLQKGEPVFEFKNRYRCKDGSYRWLNWTSQPRPEHGFTYAVARDVTDSERTAEALRASQAKLAAILDASPCAIVVADLDGRVVDANTACLNMFRVPSKEEGIGRNIFDFVSPPDRDRAEDDLATTLMDGQGKNVEYLLLRTDGSELLGAIVSNLLRDAHGNATGLVTVATDITERVRAERALQESETRYRSLVEESADAVGIFQEGKLVFINPAGTRMLGAGTREELLGRTGQELIHPDDFAPAMDRIRRREAGEADLYPAEVRYVRLDGTTVPVEVTATPIVLAGRPALQFTARDITERKRAETLTKIQHDLAVSLGAVGDLDEGLHLCLLAALRASGTDCGAVYLRDKRSGGLVMPCHTGLSEAFVARVTHLGPDTANTQVVMGGRPVYATFETLGVPLDETTKREGLQAIAVIPILHRNQVIGCLNVASHSLAEVPTYSRSVLETIAGQIGGTITRLQAEEEVRRERELLNRIADTSPVGITVVDCQGRLTFANPTAERILGLNRDQITQRTYNAPAWQITDHEGGFFPDEQLPFRRVMATGQPVQDVCHAIQRPDGRRILLAVNAAPLMNAAGQIEGMVATTEDVTERIRAEQALRESEERYRAFLANSSEGIWRYEGERPVSTSLPAQQQIEQFLQYGYMAECNDALARMYGLDRAESLIGRRLKDLTAHDPRNLEHLQAFIQSGYRLADAETIAQDREGQTHHFLNSFVGVIENNHLVRVWGVQRDVTERKRAETALQASERRFRAIIEQSGDVFTLVDAQGHTRYDSPSVTHRFGYNENENVGRLVWDLIHPADGPETKSRFERLVREGGCDTVELRLRHKDGSWRWIEATAVNLLGNPDVGAVVITYRDITERKQADAALRESEATIRSVFRAAPVGICIMKGRVYQSVNEYWCDRFGYAPARIVGATTRMLYASQEEYERVGQALYTDLPTVGLSSTETRLRCADGSFRDVILTAAPIHPDDASGGTVVVIHDITERRRAEEALRESEERYRLLLQNANDAVYVHEVSPEAPGRLLEVNECACRMLGYTREEFARMRISDIDVPEQQARLPAILRQLYETGSALFETEHVAKDGRRIPVEASTCMFHLRGRPTILSFARDITERTQAEAALRESEERFRATFEQAAVGVAHVGLDGRWLRVNQRLCDIVGYTIEEMQNHTFQDITHPDDLDTDLALMGQILAGERAIYAMEKRYTRQDGSLVWVNLTVALVRDSAGQPKYFIGVIEDITVRKQAEEALRESREAFRDLVENINDVLYRMDWDGVMTYVSPAVERALGYLPSELVGRPFWPLIAPPDVPILEKGRRDLLNHNFYPSEFRVRTKAGDLRWVRTSSRPITEAGAVTGIQGVLVDIHERKQAEEALRSSEQKLRDILNGSPVPLFVIDRNHTVIHWNPALERCSGLSGAEMIGTRQHWRAFYAAERPCLADLLVEGDLAGISPWYAGRCKASEVVEGAYRSTDFFPHLGKGGKWLEFTSVVIRNTTGATIGALEMLEDITERRRAEEALRESEEMLSAIVGRARDGILLLQGQRLIFVNPALSEMSGYSREELLSQPFIDKVAPESQNVVAQRARSRLKGENPPPIYEARIRRADGQIMDVELSATAIQYRGVPTDVGIVRDITERKKAEAALARSEEKFSRVFQASPALIAISRLRDGGLVDVNESFLQVSGYRREEILGRTLSELGFWPSPEDREHFVQGLAAGEPVRDCECRFRTRAGRILHACYSAEVVEIGGETCLLSVFVDVTERKRAEELLQAREKQLRVLASELALAEERERRRIAGELHDHACQSLVLARMQLDEMLACLPGTQAQTFREISHTLNEAIEGVRELTFDLSSPTLYRFGLEEALEELLGDKFRAQKGVEYGFSDDCQPKPLTDDVRVVLFQSVREILINILKHAHADKIDLDVRRAGGSIRITVTDDGVGFNVDEVFSLAPRHRGFGLISIKERLDYIGGTLEIESLLGEGSRFVLVAPLKESHDSGRNHDVGPNPAGG